MADRNSGFEEAHGELPEDKGCIYGIPKIRIQHKIFEEHREEFALHKAAKDAFEQLNSDKLPTIRELNEEYIRVLIQKSRLRRI